MASEAQPRSEKGTGKATLSSFAHLYLVLYNVSLCVGWFLVLLVTARYLTAEGGFGWRCPGLYAQVKTFLLVSQSAAVLEVRRLHVWSNLSNKVFCVILSKVKGGYNLEQQVIRNSQAKSSVNHQLHP